MLSKRLKSIATFIDVNDKVVDIGCDHGLLGIYLVKNNLVNKMYLSDINKNALKNAVNNIKKYNVKIDTIISNGLENIDIKLVDTIVISGMGTHTIMDILSSDKVYNINKIIIQSNNNLDILRKFMNKIGFYLEDEITISDKGIYYVIGKYIRCSKKNKKINILYGLERKDKIEYYNYLINTNNTIYKNIPKNNIYKRISIKYNNYLIKKLLKKCKTI
jgi:tRNA (adenine22-N1)-methyltransferase